MKKRTEHIERLRYMISDGEDHWTGEIEALEWVVEREARLTKQSEELGKRIEEAHRAYGKLVLDFAKKQPRIKKEDIIEILYQIFPEPRAVVLEKSMKKLAEAIVARVGR